MLPRKQVTQLGEAKESLARLRHDLGISEGPWDLQCAMAEGFTRGCWEFGQQEEG